MKRRLRIWARRIATACSGGVIFGGLSCVQSLAGSVRGGLAQGAGEIWTIATHPVAAIGSGFSILGGLLGLLPGG